MGLVVGGGKESCHIPIIPLGVGDPPD